MLQSPTDPQLYVASEIERRLLLTATENIIAGENIIGSSLLQLLKNRTFINHFNVATLSSLDILKLLRFVLPGEWFWESTSVAVRPSIVTDDWLRDIWGYIISSNACAIFDGSLPLLPVFMAGDIGDRAAYLVKLRPGVPLLHMMFHENMPGIVMECLATMGLYVYNPAGMNTSHNDICPD